MVNVDYMPGSPIHRVSFMCKEHRSLQCTKCMDRWMDGWMDGWMDEGECKCDVVSMELVLRRDGQSRRITFVCMNDRIDKRRSRKEIIITLCADIICLHNVYAKVWIKDV